MNKIIVLLMALAVGMMSLNEGLAQTKESAQNGTVLLPYKDIRWEAFGEEFPDVYFARLNGDFTKGAYAIYVKLPPGFKLPLHYHGNDQWGTVVSGNLIIATEKGKDVILGPGSYVSVPKGVRHTTAAGREGCVFLEVSNEKESTMMIEAEMK
jgi:quercetin dioxygenase-like cupin family protein